MLSEDVLPKMYGKLNGFEKDDRMKLIHTSLPLTQNTYCGTLYNELFIRRSAIHLALLHPVLKTILLRTVFASFGLIATQFSQNSASKHKKLTSNFNYSRFTLDFFMYPVT